MYKRCDDAFQIICHRAALSFGANLDKQIEDTLMDFSTTLATVRSHRKLTFIWTKEAFHKLHKIAAKGCPQTISAGIGLDG